MNIICVGAGVMSSAFAVSQAASHTLKIVPSPYDQAVASRLTEGVVDERLDVQWPNIPFVMQADVDTLDMIVIGVSSQGMPWAIDVVKQLLKLKTVPVVLLTKGLIQSDVGIEVLSEYCKRRLGVEVLAITGPCIAKLLAHEYDSEVVISSADDVLSKSVADSLSNSYYRILVESDHIGCQWAAALKNVYAIIVARTGDNLNMRSSMFALCIQEMAAWVEEQGGNPNSVYGLSGIGDLYVTCHGGRNGRFGQYLADGLSVDAICAGPMKGVTIEGLELALSIMILPIAKTKPLFQTLAADLG